MSRMDRRIFLAATAASAASVAFGRSARAGSRKLDALLSDARSLEPLETVIVSRRNETLAERAYGDSALDAPTNIKSASKTIVSAMVGIAIDNGLLESADQRIAPLLENDLPEDPDPRLAQVTIGNLLSMQAGLERTSGPNYGRWVASDNWVRAALAHPFVADPGGRMLYSTGSTHLLSAILTRVSQRTTFELARDWFAPVRGFSIAAWDRDPQGIYFGGNQMAMSPRSLHAFGALYLNGGRAADGRRVVSESWIAKSWRRRTTSHYSGDGYGYGWFLREIAGEPVRYAWGYGGQMLYLAPDAGLVVTMTSDPSQPSARTGHRDDLHALMGAIIARVRDHA